MPSFAAQSGRVPVSKASKSGRTSARRISPGPVRAEIHEKETIAVARAGIVTDHRRCHEFVGLAARVGRLDRRGGCRRALRPSSVQDRLHRRFATRSQRLSRSMA